ALRSLHLGVTGLRPDTLRRCGALKNLERLALSGSGYTGSVLAALPAMPALKRFFLRSSGTTDACLACLERMPALEQLELNVGKKMTGAGLARLASPGQLRVLNFSAEGQVGEELAAGLAGCVGLHELRLGGWRNQITEAALTFLSGLTELR